MLWKLARKVRSFRELFPLRCAVGVSARSTGSAHSRASFAPGLHAPGTRLWWWLACFTLRDSARLPPLLNVDERARFPGKRSGRLS